uniref:Uncharacterized protein n=1 Tax=Rhizophora mucronata TaxID=61149 RepID=A0A2P2IHQ8_RHIMU
MADQPNLKCPMSLLSFHLKKIF